MGSAAEPTTQREENVREAAHELNEARTSFREGPLGRGAYLPLAQSEKEQEQRMNSKLK
jgi:hypothetical protein